MIEKYEKNKEETVSIEIRSLFGEVSLFERKGKVFNLYIDHLIQEKTQVYDELLENPNKFINLFKKIIKEEFGEGFKIRFKNFHTAETISNFRVSHIGKIFKIKGMIGKTNKTLALVEFSYHECHNCGSVLKIYGGGKPSGCSCGSSNPRKFRFIKNDYRNIQEIEVEESQDELEDRQPQKIRVRLLDELTDSDMTGQLQPGNKVEVIGIVEEIPIMNKKIDEELYEYRINCLDIISLEEQNDDENLLEEDIEQIRELSQKPEILDILAKSLAPEVIGLEEIKKSLVLQQFGGVKKKMKDGKLTRDRIHILLIGDAGLSKTQLGKNVVLRTPRSFYTSGEQSSSAGLTATVEKDELTGNWGLKAGAMCKANESILVVDEVDKTGELALRALHTPLESGIIPVSKAGINTQLRAECSLLALANPKGGRFDFNSTKTIVEQINMPSTLLSRFDLIHVVKDEIDEKKDGEIIDYIVYGGEDFEEIPVDLYRKYVLYAKRFKPKFSKEIVEELKSFYNKIRKQSISSDSKMTGMPITPRNIQGIIRLAEASAKIRLSGEVSLEDLKLAQDLYYNSLLKIGMDEEGVIDFARVGGGKTLSKKKKMHLVLDYLNNLFIAKNQPIEESLLKEALKDNGLEDAEFHQIIYDLNHEGYIIKHDKGWVVI